MTGQAVGPFARRVAEFQDIVVVPVSRGAPRLMPMRGGPQFPPDSPPWVHHCRAGSVFDDTEAIVDVAGRDAPLPGRFLYVGPSWPHFGHFVSEFMHRLWPLGMPQYADATALLVQAQGQQRPRYVDQLLDVFGVTRVVEVDRPVRVEHLIVGEPGKMLGAPPAEEYLDYLDRKLTPSLAASAETPRRLAVLRPHIQKGRCIGEAWLEQVLQADGYTVFRPEEHAIHSQMAHYFNASEIVFSEGSAIHLIDVMPRLGARIAVLARRHGSRLPGNSLSKKCGALHVYDDCLAFAPPQNPRGAGAMGLSWFDKPLRGRNLRFIVTDEVEFAGDE